MSMESISLYYLIQSLAFRPILAVNRRILLFLGCWNTFIGLFRTLRKVLYFTGYLVMWALGVDAAAKAGLWINVKIFPFLLDSKKHINDHLKCKWQSESDETVNSN